MSIEQIVYILDKVGILAFSFVGVTIGVRKKLDVFGLLLVGVVSAIGGGILRDLAAGRIPLIISNIDYLLIAFTASFFWIVFIYFGYKVPKILFLLADTLGLAAFGVAGAIVSLDLDLSIFHTILFSVITAVGGGVIRDIMLNEIPFILRKEVYASAAAIGAVIMQLAWLLGFGLDIVTIIGLVAISIIRFLAIYKNWNLPVLKSNLKK
jgi:uncharacterized membrane protein YeiH